MPPNKQKGGAGTANPEHRPNGQIAANSKAQSSRSAGRRHVPGQTDLLELFAENLLDVPDAISRRSRTAFASLLAPDCGRANWALSYGCPFCGQHHRGLAPTKEAASGKRISRCGRVVHIVIARVYGEVTP